MTLFTLDELVSNIYKYFFYKTKSEFRTKPLLVNKIIENNKLFKLSYNPEDEQINKYLEDLFINVELLSVSNNRITLVRKNRDQNQMCKINIFFYDKKTDMDNLGNMNNINMINRFLTFSNSGKRSWITMPIQNFDV